MREKGQTEVAKTLETPVFSRGIEILTEKTKLYEDYRQAKKQMQEYGVVKKNVDSILYPSQSRAREQER